MVKGLRVIAYGRMGGERNNQIQNKRVIQGGEVFIMECLRKKFEGYRIQE